MKRQLAGMMTGAVALVMAAVQSAPAEIILSDSFNTGVGTPLHGRTPEFVKPGAPEVTGATWINGGTSNQIQAGGTVNIGADGWFNARLNFSPQPDTIYRWTVDVASVSGEVEIAIGEWGGVWGQWDSMNVMYWGPTVGDGKGGYHSIRIGTNSSYAFKYGAGGDALSDYVYTVFDETSYGYSSTGVNTYSLELDTGANTVTYFMNGTKITSRATIAFETGINSVAFGRTANAGNPSYSIDSVQLEVIPEPGSGLMLMGALAGIGVLRRKLHGRA